MTEWMWRLVAASTGATLGFALSSVLMQGALIDAEDKFRALHALVVKHGNGALLVLAERLRRQYGQ